MTTYIRADHARVMGSRVDVVTLLHHGESCEILLRIFHTDGVE